jgi:hypothetical protein
MVGVLVTIFDIGIDSIVVVVVVVVVVGGGGGGGSRAALWCLGAVV